MGLGTRLLIFLITFHTLLYFAGQAGYLPAKSDSPHKVFVDHFTDPDELENAVEGSAVQNDTEDSGGAIIDLGVFSPLFELFTFLDVLQGLLFMPYDVIGKSPLPTMLKWIFGGILSVLEIAVVVSFVRGFDL